MTDGNRRGMRSVEDSEPSQHACEVCWSESLTRMMRTWPEIDAGSDLTELARLLVEIDIEATIGKRECSSGSADASANLQQSAPSQTAWTNHAYAQRVGQRRYRRVRRSATQSSRPLVVTGAGYADAAWRADADIRSDERA